MWCRNNLIAVGKWHKLSFLFGVIIVFFVFGNNINFSNAYETSSSRSSEFKIDLNPMSSINKLDDITLPVNDLINDALKGLRFNQNLNIDTGIPVSPIKNSSMNIDFTKFFGSSTVSSNDLTSFLKEAVVTGINLSILVISITSQVLKGLLDAIK